TTSYFVTLISNIISLIIGFLFSFAIVRYAKEWIAAKDFIEVFHVVAISAFKSRSWPWGASPRNLKALLEKRRWVPGILIILCIGCFTTVTSSITSLLTPTPFIQNTTLTGQELDFSSNDPDCLDFLDANPISNMCDWESYMNLNYTNCLGENQIVDVLESGRGSILSLIPNNSQSLTYSQIGGNDGLHVLGSIRGILPIGPNGVPAFNTLKASPFSEPVLTAAMLSYNYTLNHQGLKTNISCFYDNPSPINVASVDPNSTLTLALTYSANCEGAAQVLMNVTSFNSINSPNALAYWACQSPPNSTETPEYFVYLRGLHFYEAIGNITCNIRLVETGIFPATYQSLPEVFSLAKPASSAPLAFSGLIEHALVALGDVISEGQNFEANDVAESVITFGVKSFGLQPYEQTPKYLELYQAMIQGILDYAIIYSFIFLLIFVSRATYVRLIYSTLPNPPSSCTREVTGTLSYQVIGWSVRPAHIGFLMPMTVVNLASLVILLTAMSMARSGVETYDPTDPRVLMNDVTVRRNTTQEADEWADKVAFGTNGVCW
ncbi:hypothetical protein CPB84DRAFT_1691252, partial [Gymnopilus junonius]